jgi:hypothetical protein
VVAERSILDRTERGDQRRSHRMGYPRHPIWLQRRRDRPGDFSIKSTRVQSFDNAITGTKRAQSLNSGNRTIRGRRCPKSALRPRDGRARNSPPSDHRNIARIRYRSIGLPGSVCGRRSRPASRYLSTEKPADDYFAPHGSTTGWGRTTRGRRLRFNSLPSGAPTSCR